MNLSHILTTKAKQLGFNLIGFTSPKIPGDFFKHYEKWLEKGHQSDMHYLEKTSPRKNLEELLPGVKTVIVLATNYYYAQKPLKTGYGRIARYAYGRDYHKVIGKKLKEMEKFIQTLTPQKLTPKPHSAKHSAKLSTTYSGTESEIRTKSYVDTGPILERALAVQAGLGQIGKNSCLITREFGSWVFLSVILTTLDFAIIEGDTSNTAAIALSENKTAVNFRNIQHSPKDICGTCTKCIDACPLKAITRNSKTGAYYIDANKCISYHTIENKGEIPRSFHQKIRESGCLFGCDICQQVCPHNCRQKPHAHEELKNPKIAGDQLPLKKLLAMKTETDFLSLLAGSPLTRPKLSGLQRNARILNHQPLSH